jgi:hypothetical protein
VTVVNTLNALVEDMAKLLLEGQHCHHGQEEVTVDLLIGPWPLQVGDQKHAFVTFTSMIGMVSSWG